MIDKEESDKSNNSKDNNNNPNDLTQSIQISYEMKMNISKILLKFFKEIKDEKEECIKTFKKINKLPEFSKEMTYLCFWYTFVNNSDEFLAILFSKDKVSIYYRDLIINPSNLDLSTTEINSYAFEIVKKLGLTIDILKEVVKSGKILIELEWMMQLMISGTFKLVELIWESGNYCYFSDENTQKIFFDSIVKRNNICEEYNLEDSEVKNDKKSSKISSNNIKNYLKSMKEKSNTFNTIYQLSEKETHDTDEYSKKLKFINEMNISGEISILYLENKAALDITILLILANITPYYDLEIHQNANIDKNKVDKSISIVRTIILMDKEKKNSLDIITGLYLIKKEEIILELVKSNFLLISYQMLNLGIKHKIIKFILLVYKMYSDFNFFKTEELHIDIIQSLDLDISNLEAYLFLILKLQKYFNLKTAQHLIKTFDSLLIVTDMENPILSKHSNPLKIFVLIAEILNILRILHPIQEYHCNRLMKKALEFSEEIQNNSEEDNILREMILEVDFRNKSILQIISDNNFLSLLKNNLVEKIIHDQWKGLYDLKGSFLQTSSSWNSLFVSINSKDYDVFTKLRNQESFKSCFYQFKVFKKHIFTKFLFQIIMSIFLLILVQILSINLLLKYQDIYFLDKSTLVNMSNNYDQMNTITEKIYSDYIINKDFSELTNLEKLDILIKSNSNSTLYNNISNDMGIVVIFFDSLSKLKDISNLIKLFAFFILFIPANCIIRLVYWIKYKKPSISQTFIPDTLIVILSLILIIYLGSESSMNIYTMLDYYSSNDIKNYNYDVTMLKNEIENFINKDPYGTQFLLISIYLVLFWIKFILNLTGTKTFGPLIVIFLLSVKGVTTYLIGLIVFIFIFSIFSMMNFYNTKAYYYTNIFYAFMQHLFITMGGDTQYSDYLNDDISETKSYAIYLYGFFLLLLYLINTIVIINLIVALLTNIFENYKINSIQLFIREQISLRNYFYSNDKRYSALLNTFFPFNVMITPFSIIYLFISEPKLLESYNNLVNYINYSFFFLIYLSIFSIINFCMIPITYAKVLITKAVQIFVDDIQEYLIQYKIMSFFLYLFFGMILQIVSFFRDIYIFIDHCFNKKIEKLIDSEEKGKFYMKEMDLILLHKFLCICLSNNILIHDSLCIAEEFSRYTEFCKENIIENENISGYIENKHEKNKLDGDSSSKTNQNTNSHSYKTKSKAHFSISVEFLNLYKNRINVNKSCFESSNLRLKKFKEVESTLHFYNMNLEDLLDFLSNFEEEEYINIKRTIFILNNKLKHEKTKEFYRLIDDKSFKINFDLSYKSFLSKTLVFNQSNMDTSKLTSNDLNLFIQAKTKSSLLELKPETLKLMNNFNKTSNEIKNRNQSNTASTFYKNGNNYLDRDVESINFKVNNCPYKLLKNGSNIYPILSYTYSKKLLRQQDDFQYERTERLLSTNLENKSLLENIIKSSNSRDLKLNLKENKNKRFLEELLNLHQKIPKNDNFSQSYFNNNANPANNNSIVDRLSNLENKLASLDEKINLLISNQNDILLEKNTQN